jgi:serine/threonine protein kinase
VKLDNVLLTGLDATVKLADFGWSCLAEEGNCHGASTGCFRPLSGTAEYVAPEVCTLQHLRMRSCDLVSAAAEADSFAQHS